jgi:hypothetical protein
MMTQGPLKRYQWGTQRKMVREKFFISVNSPAKSLRSDDYHEQSRCCYPNNQKRKCDRVKLKPMFVQAQRSLFH